MGQELRTESPLPHMQSCHITASVACETSSIPKLEPLPSRSCHCGFALLLGQRGVGDKQGRQCPRQLAVPLWSSCQLTHQFPSYHPQEPGDTMTSPAALTSQGHSGGGMQLGPRPQKVDSDNQIFPRSLAPEAGLENHV